MNTHTNSVVTVINVADIPCMDEDHYQWLKNRFGLFHAQTAETQAAMVEAAHDEALNIDAEFNFERVSRAINQSAHNMQLRQYYWFELYSYSVRADKLAAAHAEALEMNQSRNETVRAIIAQALHVGANSFGHVLGEHEELVATLCNAGFVSEADRVDAAMNAIGGDDHKVIRRNWLEALRKVSATL